MYIAVIGQEKELEAMKGLIKNEGISLTTFRDINSLSGSFTAVFDFSFNPEQAHIEKLLLCSTCVFINSVCYPLENNFSGFIRFNGWNSFIQRDKLEIAVSEKSNPAYKKLLEEMGIFFVEVPNITGFVSPRIISMLINEAFFALEENVSTKEQIDIAMRLGTNYPYGPFEWGEQIGLENIVRLLLKLSEKDERYTIANAMLESVKNKN